jgi:hypothetical protein
MERRGIVYLAEDPEEHPPFSGYWDAGDPPAMLERGPGWTDPEDAVGWGRDRANVVLTRLWPDRYYSAGEEQPRRERLPLWPRAAR